MKRWFRKRINATEKPCLLTDKLLLEFSNKHNLGPGEIIVVYGDYRYLEIMYYAEHELK